MWVLLFVGFISRLFPTKYSIKYSINNYRIDTFGVQIEEGVAPYNALNATHPSQKKHLFPKNYNITTDPPKYNVDESEMLIKIINNHNNFELLNKLKYKYFSDFYKLILIRSMESNVKISNVKSGGLLYDWDINIGVDIK